MRSSYTNYTVIQNFLLEIPETGNWEEEKLISKKMAKECDVISKDYKIEKNPEHTWGKLSLHRAFYRK